MDAVTYDKLCYKTDDGCDEQVHVLTLIESQLEITHVDRDKWNIT